MLKGKGGDDCLEGGGGKDKLNGGGGKDELKGGGGADTLKGGGGKDKLIGGGGADLLIGGKAKDKLKGGKGADTFKFGKKDGPDVIQDFGKGKDKIDLTKLKTSFEELTIKEKAKKAIVKVDDLKITVKGPGAMDLAADDFLF